MDAVPIIQKLLEHIDYEVQTINADFGRRLRDVTTSDIYVQHARGKLEAYKDVVAQLKELCGV